MIIVAVLLGVVLLNATDEPFTTTNDRAADDGSAAGAKDDGATIGDSLPDDGSDTTVPTDTTVAAVARPPGEVTVLVANGSGVAGSAAEFTERVGTSGYLTADPSNLSSGGTVPASAVYYTDGFEAEAQALAATLSPVPQVAPLPAPAPVDDLRGATVLLVVGPDLATG